MARIINPHASMIYHDPQSKDMNNYQIVTSQEKAKLILNFARENLGKQLYVVNVSSGEVRLWEMKPNAWNKPTRHARVNAVHLLFGDWRLASPEDIAKQSAKDKVIADQIARLEANKTAKKAGIMFSELTNASKAIMEYERLNSAEPKEEKAEKEITFADLDALQAKLDAARKALKSNKEPVEKKA